MASVLVDDIARLIGREPEELQMQFAALMDRVQATIEVHGGARIEGLGLFRRTDDALTFEPEEGLTHVINPIHGGLRPIEVGAEGPLLTTDFQPDPFPDAEDVESGVALGAGSEGVEDTATDGVWTPRLEGGADELGEAVDEMEDAEFAVLPSVNEASSQVPNAHTYTRERVVTPVTPIVSTAPLTTRAEEAVAAAPRTSLGSGRHPVLVWGLPVLAVLAAGLWLLLWIAGDDPEPLPGVEQVVSEQVPASPVGAATPVQAAVETAEDTTLEPVAETTVVPPEPVGFTAPDGRWTWRIAAHTSRATAEAALRRFERPELPGEVVRAVVNGQVWYRVTLGRYATVEQARAARPLLPTNLPDDAFVGPIN